MSLRGAIRGGKVKELVMIQLKETARDFLGDDLCPVKDIFNAIESIYAC